MNEPMDMCPECGQEMLIYADENPTEPMYLYHPVWVKQNIDPPCTNTVTIAPCGHNYNRFDATVCAKPGCSWGKV